MLTYNIQRIFKARGVEKPYSFLRQHGFSNNFASRLKQNNIYRIDPRELEKLCVILHCTPNDLLEWTDDGEYTIDGSHPLRKLMSPDKNVDMNKTINSIPLNKVAEIEDLIKAKLKEYEGEG